MDGVKFRYHDHHEFFHPTTKVGPGVPAPAPVETAPRKRPKMDTLTVPDVPPPAPPSEHHRHCTAGEIARELGYSTSYILAVKKAMFPDPVTRPRRLDPAAVSEWIYAHPAFRMREVYECHPKDLAQGQRLLEF